MPEKTLAHRAADTGRAQAPPWPIFWIACIAVFLVSLDGTVLFAAFGALRQAFPKATAADDPRAAVATFRTLGGGWESTLLQSLRERDYMEKQMTTLFPYQKEALLAALRRDMRRELEMAATESQWADFHLMNARTVKSILEVLNPIAPRAQKSNAEVKIACDA